MAPEQRPVAPRTGPNTEAEELSAADRLLKLWNTYRVPIVAGILIFLAVAVAVTWQLRARAERRQEAALRLNAAASLYQGVFQSEPSPTIEEAEERLGRAIELCRQVVSEFPGLETAWWARYLEGDCQFTRADHEIIRGRSEEALARLDEAVEAFRRCKEEAPSARARAQAMIALAACYENRAFFSDDPQMMQAAIEELRQAAPLAEGTYLEGQALINLGRCLEALGRRDDAATIYTRVQSLRAPLEQATAGGPMGLTRQAGFHQLAAERLERLRSGIDAPEGS